MRKDKLTQLEATLSSYFYITFTECKNCNSTHFLPISKYTIINRGEAVLYNCFINTLQKENMMNLIFLIGIVFVLTTIISVVMLKKRYNGRITKQSIHYIFPLFAYPITLYLLVILLIPAEVSIDNISVNNILLVFAYKIYDVDAIIYYVLTTIITTFILTLISNNVIRNNVYKGDQSIPLFEGFVNDARSLHVFGKHLEFLHISSHQERKFIELGNKCNIICNEPKDKKTALLYKKLIDGGCNLRVTEEVEYRGQIKSNGSQNNQACIVEKRKDKYLVLDMESSSLVAVMLERMKTLFEEGYSPFPKIIVLDVGGVYFDGDYHKDFVDVINAKYNIKIPKNYKDKQLLDRDLNLGDITITDFIEKKIMKSLTVPQKKYINKLWGEIWKPNKDMKKLVNELKSNGYTICFFSNIDAENGVIYDNKGYFPSGTRQYFSYETKKIIPDKDAYMHLMDKESCKPREILYIDDRMDNIDIANKIGWKSYHYINTENDKFSNLLKNLEKENIFINYDKFREENL